ncbi:CONSTITUTIVE EXPRESSER OF PR GENES 1, CONSTITUTIVE EXPRESSER OF PR GENES 30 [Hibiscus trionum]|uniref:CONSTITUTIVE EXPRESSER OF PR GENES 1, CONSTITUTIVE EXPRESSER OF PR GENES 30 n=1 Tax=Hibiscus trionum TaxID=183268 RepID=A0A9W7HN41_HIBTR|nr:CONSTITUTIVE EXPRESSER OF PR GENES 1, CONSTITUTIVE EXPRESSER OF PR GENES 30 [Hibiscus trionum]
MSDYMAVEVILEILKRLPVKSVVKCRSVCKTWNTLISHPSFISAHLQASFSRPPNNTPFLLLRYEKNGPKKYFLHYDNDGFDEFKQLRFSPFGCVSDFIVRGSCNGLICLILLPAYVLNFVLWNPSIQKCISLPQPNISEAVELNVGFGFDSRTNDYKIVMVGVEEDGSWIQPYLFSLNQNCWKRVIAIPPNYTFQAVTGISLPFVNGALHWLGYQTRNNDEYIHAILGFDLSSEDFFEINLPESLIGLCPMDLLIMNYGESSIAFSTDPVLGEHELWVMKDYGVVESWTKVLTLTLNIQRKWFPVVLGFRKNGQVLLQVDDGEMASLDLSCSKMEPHGVEVGAGLISVCGCYVESLVLLDKAVDVHNGSHVRTGP